MTAINVTNKVALYNFLSTFSGTHFLTPHTYRRARLSLLTPVVQEGSGEECTDEPSCFANRGLVWGVIAALPKS